MFHIPPLQLKTKSISLRRLCFMIDTKITNTQQENSQKYFLNMIKLSLPARIYLFEVNNGNTRTICEICSKLTIKTSERRQ